MAHFKQGNLQLNTNQEIQLGNNQETSITYDGSTLSINPSSGSVELYYDGSKVLETTTLPGPFSGISIFGPSGTGQTDLYQAEGQADFAIENMEDEGLVYIKATNTSSASRTLFSGDPDGNVRIYNPSNNTQIFNSQTKGILTGSSQNIAILSETGYASYYNTSHGDSTRFTGEDSGGTPRVLFNADPDGSTTLYASGAQILDATSTGVDVTGDLDVSGHGAFGTASPNPIIGLWVAEDFNASTCIGQYITLDNSLNDAGAKTIGIDGSVQLDNSALHELIQGGSFFANSTAASAAITDIIGVGGRASVTANSTITNMVGGHFETVTAFGMADVSVTSMIGGRFQILNTGSGATDVTNGYGALIQTPGYTSSGTTTNLYGLYVEDQSTVGFTNDYNIFSAGQNSQNKFEGNLQVLTLQAIDSAITISTSAGNVGLFVDNDSTTSFYYNGGYVFKTTSVGFQSGVAAFSLLTSTGEDGLTINTNGSVELFHNNDKKFETTATGAAVTGDLEYLNINTETAQATASNSDVVLADGTGGALTVYLTEKDRAIIRVKKIDSSNTITVEGLTGTIDGAANITLTSQYESMTFVCDGTNWFIV